MKKIVIPVLALLIIVLGFSLFYGNSSEKTNNTVKDYTAISRVKSEMASIAGSSVVKSLNSDTSWNIYELGLMYQKEEKFFKKLREDLGEDFPWKLSNGDSLFIGVYPLKRKYRVYAGAPDMDHMIYPTWNYQALPDPTGGTAEQ